MKTKTPRTDLVVTEGNPAAIQRFADLLEHARSLERELAAMHELYVEGRLEREHRRMKRALLEIEKFAAGTVPGTHEQDRIAEMARASLEGETK